MLYCYRVDRISLWLNTNRNKQYALGDETLLQASGLLMTQKTDCADAQPFLAGLGSSSLEKMNYGNNYY